MKTLILLTSLILSTVSFAGAGHGHSHAAPAVSKEKIQEIGKHHIERLVKAGKLDASWKEASFDKSEKKKFGKKTEWIVTFNNKKGVKGKKLYIFLKLSGKFVAANFTGK